MDYFNEGVVFVKSNLFIADCFWILPNYNPKKNQICYFFLEGFGLVLTGPEAVTATSPAARPPIGCGSGLRLVPGDSSCL